jgi:hypothetical protein
MVLRFTGGQQADPLLSAELQALPAAPEQVEHLASLVMDFLAQPKVRSEMCMMANASLEAHAPCAPLAVRELPGEAGSVCHNPRDTRAGPQGTTLVRWPLCSEKAPS